MMASTRVQTFLQDQDVDFRKHKQLLFLPREVVCLNVNNKVVLEVIQKCFTNILLGKINKQSIQYRFGIFITAILGFEFCLKYSSIYQAMTNHIICFLPLHQALHTQPFPHSCEKFHRHITQVGFEPTTFCHSRADVLPPDHGASWVIAEGSLNPLLAASIAMISVGPENTICVLPTHRCMFKHCILSTFPSRI